MNAMSSQKSQKRTISQKTMPETAAAPGTSTSAAATSAAANGSVKSNASADLYWIHCNSCFEMYTRKVKRIFLLSCHHLCCECCTKEQPKDNNSGNSSNYKCPVCCKIVRGRELGNNIPPQLKLLFHPKPWTDCIFSVQIFNFQQKQRSHYINGFILPLHKYQKRMTEKQEYWRKRTKQTYEELQALKLDRRKLESRVRRVIEERKKQEHAKKMVIPPAPSESSLNTRRSQSQFLGIPTSAGRGRLIPPTRSVSSASNSFVSKFNNGFANDHQQKYFRL